MDLVKGLHVQINPEIIKKIHRTWVKIANNKKHQFTANSVLNLAVSDVIHFAFCQLGSQWRVKHKSEQTQVPSSHLVVDIKLSTSQRYSWIMISPV